MLNKLQNLAHEELVSIKHLLQVFIIMLAITALAVLDPSFESTLLEEKKITPSYLRDFLFIFCLIYLQNAFSLFVTSKVLHLLSLAFALTFSTICLALNIAFGAIAYTVLEHMGIAAVSVLSIMAILMSLSFIQKLNPYIDRAPKYTQD